MKLRQNTLKTRLRQGDVVFGCFLQAARDPEVVYHVAAAGADFCFIDLEHGPLSLESAVDLVLHAHAAGITPVIRLPDLQYAYVTRLLDNGAQTLLLPHVTMAEEVDRFVELAKYAPLGRRGMAMGLNGGTNFAVVPDLVAGAQWANDNVCLGVTIETRGAAEAMGEILRPGIDFTLVGFQDLAQDYGVLGQHDHALVASAQAEARRLCAERGIAYMAVPMSLDDFDQAVALGAQMLLYGGTMGFVRAGVDAAARRLDSLKHPSVTQ